MPILIRIILQRLLIFTFSILAFFGINPDISIPTPEVVQEQKNVEQKRVEDILQIPQEEITPQSSSTKIIKDVEQKITEIQKEFTNTIAQPVANTVKEIAPTGLVYTQESTSFNIKNVVVNILCMEKTKTYTKLSSGSGVIVSPSGLVLTNAHVTYPFLKTPQFGSSTYSCSIRRENIPNYGYNAELVYYPYDWLVKNNEIVKEASPIGTGENDYALLQITSALGPVPKTSAFAYASTNISASDLKKDLNVMVAGYPSSNSGVFNVDTKPGLKTAVTTIADFFTFGTRSFDVLQTGVNDVAHRGSSGGGIFNNENLYGIVVTTNSNSQGSYINALTIPYIKDDLKKDTGLDLSNFENSSYDTLKRQFDSSYKGKIQKFISEN